MMSSISDDELKVLDDFRAAQEDEVMDTQEANRLGPL